MKLIHDDNINNNLYTKKIAVDFIDYRKYCNDGVLLDVSKNCVEFWITDLMNHENVLPIIHDDPDYILNKAWEDGCEYVVVGALGITYKNEGPEFFQLLNQNWDPDFTIIGHLLDKKDPIHELHNQTFIVNLKWWASVGKPEIGHGQTFTQEHTLPNVLRSEENHHDDYTPLWISRGEGTSTYKTVHFGWNLIASALSYNKDKIYSFTQEQRASKYFFYPTVDIPLDQARNKYYISSYVMSQTDGHFAVNTEKHYRYLNGSFDFLMTTSGGLTAILECWANNIQANSRVLINDISRFSIDFQSQIIEHIQQDPKNIRSIQKFIIDKIDAFAQTTKLPSRPTFKQINQLRDNQLITKTIDNLLLDNLTEDKSTHIGFWDYIKNIFPTLKFVYEGVNLFDADRTVRIFSKYAEHSRYPLLSISNIFNYYPTCLLYSYDERELLVNSILERILRAYPNAHYKNAGAVPIHNSLKHIIQGHSEIIEDQYGLDYEQQQEIKKYKWIN